MIGEHSALSPRVHLRQRFLSFAGGGDIGWLVYIPVDRDTRLMNDQTPRGSIATSTFDCGDVDLVIRWFTNSPM